MPKLRPPVPPELIKRIDAVIAALGLDESRGLVRRWGDYKAATNRHVVRQAFETIGIHAVFGFPSQRVREARFSPVVYLACAADDAGANALHRLVWSQGVVPILLIATPTGLQIRKSLTPPMPQSMTVAWSKLSGTADLPVQLRSLTAIALSSSIVWRDFAADRSDRVDTALLKAIASLNETVRTRHAALRDRPILVNSLIGRFIYFFVLLDRGIIDRNWIRGLKDDSGNQLCAQITNSIRDDGSIDTTDHAWPAREVWSLFDQIDNMLNGAIFPVNAADRRAVPADALHLVRRAIRHGDVLHSDARQLGFLDVSFATLRTETISAIYELFLFIEAPGAKDDEGAFYTPPFLVDYVLDEVDHIRSFTARSRVIDPAAGSGIFLVGAYRRILERAIPRKRWTSTEFKKGRHLLESAVFGIERNGQAANVARFSLYLTLLDYVENVSIKELRQLARGQSVFPTLTANVVDCDVFSLKEKDLAHLGQFTHVVGNPPWGTFGDNTDRTNRPRSAIVEKRRREALLPTIEYYNSLDREKYPVTNKRISELFVWKVQRELVQKNGVMGLLVSTRSFVAPTARAFPNALAERCKIVGLANLSHFRYRLFSGARSPTLAIFAENREPEALNPVWVYSPLLTSQPIGEHGHLWSIIVSELDVETYKLRDLTRLPEGWFWALMLRPIDRRFVNHLALWSRRFKRSFGDFLKASNLAMGRGGSASQTDLPSDLLLRSGDYQQRLGMGDLGFANYPHQRVRNSRLSGSFAGLFGGNIVFIPRHMNEITFIAEPIAFASTFNAVYALSPLNQRGVAIAGMRGIVRYLNSDVARYLFALFGKTRLLDRTRLEKHDLESIPFPFTDIEDGDLRSLVELNEDAITRLFASRVGLDDGFVQSVQEYTEFRQGYEDSQVPHAGLNPPNAAAIRRYQSMLFGHLAQQFGDGAQFDHSVRQPSDLEHFAVIDIRIGRSGTDTQYAALAAPGSVSAGIGFSPHARIIFDAVASRVVVTKPWTRVAWTVEQAYADAREISEEVLRLGAAV
ncbi:MAG: N-6 DNA methylase [Proteobacteria bacterium]|nr:N-6 DNA methylase [Pseudomonadota bacterium]MBI3499161.1 N-6 DNA methylase [Pseudomonadota bacterium]